jgi:hypothetical protein
MSADRPVACNFTNHNNNNNSTSTTTMTRTEDELKTARIHHDSHSQDNAAHNHDIATTTRDQPDEFLTHSPGITHNIAEDGIVTTQHSQERSGNTPQPKPSLTTPNNTATTHDEPPTQTTTCPTTANYTPHKTWSHFRSSRWSHNRAIPASHSR